MLPVIYTDIAPLLSRRQNVLWGSSNRRFNTYYQRHRAQLPRHSLKLIVPVLGETVTVENHDRDVRERRQVQWEDLIHHVRHGSIRKIKFRHRLNMQLRVDDAFDRMLAYLCPIRRHFTGTVMRTNVLPIHWMFLQFFMRLFSEAKAIHVKGQEEAFLTTAALEESLQPYLRPKIFSLELLWISNDAGVAAPFADWFLAPTLKDRFVRVAQGTSGAAEVIRELHERVLARDHPVFNRCVLAIHHDPTFWIGISAEQLHFVEDEILAHPRSNPRTGVRFHCSLKGSYVAITVCSEELVDH